MELHGTFVKVHINNTLQEMIGYQAAEFLLPAGNAGTLLTPKSTSSQDSGQLSE